MITSALLAAVPGIQHGFGTASALVPEPLQAAWELRPAKRQVHGTRSVRITAMQQAAGEADAFYTSASGIPVSVITADCVPLLMARRDGAMVAALHAGWRGLYAGIIGQFWHGLRERGERPSDWVAAIGPTICAACYEVSEELAQDFLRRYAALPSATILPSERHLDLRALAQHELERAGLGGFEHVGGCTCCARGADGALTFRSYRRGDRNSQQHAGVLRL
ncbi:polyphenol oxidase family protein [Massilia sp. Root351]|uniref:polyphenol oxidase family protein n=1 Tax=Massilia sp. Root351 TaxID=1736522 RepID=UPI000A471FB0|nr:polyphenol oxidase family protein [Massilia sp. Root351]